MATSGPRYPGTTANLSNAGTLENKDAWASPGNVVSDNGVESSITASTFDSPDISQILVASNFGFSADVDALATILGITVEIDRRSIIAGSGADFRVQLATGTTFADLVGSNKAATGTTWPSTTAVASYGGTADTWTASLTAAQVRAAGFAVFLSASAKIANADIGVDFIRVTITYTPGPQTLTLGLLDGAPTLYAPTVTPAPVTVTLALLDGAPTLYAPTVQGVWPVTLPLLDVASVPNGAGTVSRVGQSMAEGSSGTGTGAVAPPAAATVGRMLWAQVAISNADTITPAESGWVAGPNVTISSVVRVATFYRIVAGGDPSTYTFDWTASGRWTLMYGVYDGVDPVIPLDVAATTVSQNSGTTLTVPTLTPWTDRVMLVTGMAANWSAGPSLTAPSGFAQFETSTGGVGRGSSIADLAQTTKAATGAEVWSTPTNLAAAAYMVALRPAGSYQSAVKADSPQAHWRMGDASGYPQDASGNGHNSSSGGGTLTYGTAGALSGDSDKAIGFSATGVFAYMGSDWSGTSLPTTGALSIETWFRVDGSTGADQTIIAKIFVGLGYEWGLAWINASHVLRATLYDGTSTVRATVDSPSAYEAGSWHHAVLTLDEAADLLILYVDGSEVGRDDTWSGTSTTDTTAPVAAAGSGGTLIGTLDEVAIYPSVLSAATIAAHFAFGGPVIASLLYAPVVEAIAGAGTQDITLALLDASPTLYAPTVIPGPVSVTLGFLDASSAVYAPTLAAKNTLTLGLLDGSPAVYAPTVAATWLITLTLLDAAPTTYGPTVTATWLISIALLDGAPALYAPSMTVGPVSVIAPLLDGAPELYAPTLTQSGAATQTLTLALLDGSPATYAPAVGFTVSLGLVDAGPALYAPGILPAQFITIGFLDAGPSLFAPTLVATALTIAPPLLDASSATYAPSLAVGPVVVVLGFLDGAPSTFAPTLLATATLSLGQLDAGAALFAPAIAPAQFITTPLLDGAPATYAPVLSATQLVALGLLDGGSATYAPTIAGLLIALRGVTRNVAGAPLGNCVVKAYRTSDDAMIGVTTSDGAGVYEIAVPDSVTMYYLVAYHYGFPDVAGTTINTLVGS